MNRNDDVPCWGCDKRNALCHAECKDYTAWNAEHRAEMERRKPEAQSSSDYVKNILRVKDQIRKRRR